MRFLSNDIAAIIEITDEVLQEYFQKNSDKYLTPYSYSFYQITFSTDKRDDDYKDAFETLKKFPKASFEEMKTKGDALPFDYYFIDVNETLIFFVGYKYHHNGKSKFNADWKFHVLVYLCYSDIMVSLYYIIT